MTAIPMSRPSVARATLRWSRLAAVLLLVAAAPAAAQDSTAADAPRPYATRAELEAQAVRLEAEAARSGNAATRANAQALRERLRVGDFPAGSKIALSTTGMVGAPESVLKALNDTLVVRSGQVVQIVNMPDISVAGVLRSELTAHMRKQLERYLKNPEIRAGSPIQVQMDGQVNRPGYYTVPADTRVAELIMQAGGPTGNADMGKTEVRNGREVVISRDSLQTAINNGATLDQIDYRAGDRIVVGKRRNFGWGTFLGVLGAVTSIAILSDRLRR